MITFELRNTYELEYSWRLNNSTLHRLNGICFTTFHSNGRKFNEQYVVMNTCHRKSSDGAAFKSWYMNGQLAAIAYLENNYHHRDRHAGPAIQQWDRFGKLTYQKYKEHDVEVHPPECPR